LEGKQVDAISGRVTKAKSGEDAASTFFNALDPSDPITNLFGNLPHWRQDGATYFVTFRAADSIPQEKLHQWLEEREEWLRNNPEPHSAMQQQEYWRRFPSRFQYWLDQGFGECVLARAELCSLVESALHHFDRNRYELRDCVVMPNHVHAIVTPWQENSLSAIVQSWKSFTAHKINALLGRRGVFWQKESFDHIVRSADSLERFRDYIEANRRSRRGLRCREK
jgi:REP element-mobilizing transposase RayT